MAGEWSRAVNTTIAKYIRKEEVNILRNRKLLAMLKARGRITFNHSGNYMDWKVRYKRAPVQGYADMDVLTFARRERWKTAQLGWRGYAATDQITKMERLKNKGTEAIIKVYQEIVPALLSDIDDNFGDELYVDGNAAGNQNRLHGINSFMSYSGGSANGYVGLPNDVYAGLNCTLGNYGGSWSLNGGNVNWPSGTGDSHYDFWSPLIVDYTDTAWAATTKTWVNTAREALRFGIVKGKKNKSQSGMIDVIIGNDEQYRLFLDNLDQNERTIVSRGGSKNGLYALGFGDVINFEGTDISYEYGVPDGELYGWSMANVELCSLQSELFVPEGPDMDISTQSERFSIDFFGNLKFNPRYFVKWKNIT